ncbi:MAG: bacteriohemerythrin [Bryobacteraceae bacterium]
MQHFAWSPENEVFIAQIDAEHRDLYQLAGGLERAIEAKAPPAETRERLHALAAHLEDHFSHEEWLMQSVAYPAFGWHRQQHNTARRRVKLFVPLIEAGDGEAADLLLEFLADWLNDHTTITDRMMAAFVRNYERSHATSALERWGAPDGRAGASRTEVLPDWGEPSAAHRLHDQARGT